MVLGGLANKRRLGLFGTFVLLAWMQAAIAGEWTSPEAVEGATTVSLEEAYGLFQQGVRFVDVRSERQYRQRHIEGAAHLDLNNGFTPEALEKVVAKDEPFVIYCNGIMCGRSSRACAQAVDWGFSGVRYFRGGIVDWRRAGLPVAYVE